MSAVEASRKAVREAEQAMHRRRDAMEAAAAQKLSRTRDRLGALDARNKAYGEPDDTGTQLIEQLLRAYDGVRGIQELREAERQERYEKVSRERGVKVTDDDIIHPLDAKGVQDFANQVTHTAPLTCKQGLHFSHTHPSPTGGRVC